MTGRWQTSTRAARLPPNWKTLRQQVKRRAHSKCQWINPDGQQCQAWGSECDHIIPNDDHTINNLQWLCTSHHRLKTQAEARAARPQRRRRPEPHPGYPPTP